MFKRKDELGREEGEKRKKTKKNEKIRKKLKRGFVYKEGKG